ncbi:hypothetical protein MBAV_006056 [Candidatus Magnetobacterium bavaricum]|uniref:Uncharacterized protein n=1 Tax=Candidatus Magnetobacterium bavaricum TaxID=29290 RepID=A0A0F3GIG5_9BACT|nr:hypothetical protein MBAV_006056 [Candidatus Magnetobacterium bavaricum]
MALLMIASVSRPAPSSCIWITTFAPECPAVRCTVPCLGLPALTRTSGDSIPWSMLFLMMCTRGSLSFSMTVLSSSVSAPSVVITISLPSSLERSRTRRLNLLKVPPIGIIRIPIVLSLSSQVMRSTSSAISDSTESPKAAEVCVRRACTVTSSPTRSTRPSSFSEGTRILAIESCLARC